MSRGDVSRETSDRLRAYADMLLHWAAKIALVSHAERTFENVWKQIELSLAIAPLVPDQGTEFLDLGSGNGLPAIPLAIYTGLRAELIEADRRKASFLQTVAARLQLPIVVTSARIEATPPRSSLCVTARALAPLPRLLPLVNRHLAPGGCTLLLKGPNAAAELASVRREWEMEVQQLALDGHSSVLKISGLRRMES